MTFSWTYLWDIGPAMLQAAVATVEFTALGMTLALALGLVIVQARRSSIRTVRRIAWGYVEILRGTPVLIQLYLLFYVLPHAGITLDAFPVGVATLGIYYSTYTSEVYRAGFDSVPRGQWEAALALNFTQVQRLRLIVLPQAIPFIIPLMGNYAIGMLKATPILSTIGIRELLGQGLQLGSDSYRYAEVFTLLGGIFLLLSYPTSLGVRWLEGRVAVSRRIAVAPQPEL